MRKVKIALFAYIPALTALSVAVIAQQNLKAGWLADASNAVFPQQHAAGRLYGSDFHVDRARLSPYHEYSGKIGDPPSRQSRADGAVLTLQEGKQQIPYRCFRLFLATRPGDTIEGKTFTVPAGGLFKQTQKIMDADQQGFFFPVADVQAQSGDKRDVMPLVSLRVRFGKRQGNMVPGSVYLCLQDANKSYVAGSFQAVEEK